MEKVAVCYDWLDSFGGAERVIQVLLELYPQAQVYSLVHDSRIDWLKSSDITSAWIQYIPIIKNSRWLLVCIGSVLWRQFNFREYELVISVTSDQAKVVGHPRHVCICLTPPRHLWTQFYYYTKFKFVAVILRIIGTPMRVMDFYGAMQPAKLIAISYEVKMRIKRAYGRDVEVIYPPVGHI